MTAIRQRGKIVFLCDDCGAEYNTMTDDFRDGLEDAKSDGWVVRQSPAGEWQHFCPDCK